MQVLYCYVVLPKYKSLVLTETGASFMFIMQLMQLFSKNKADLIKVTEMLGLYYQIRDDYCNLCLQEVMSELWFPDS
jgi:geranylgeranyl diphosphate synthase type 3